MLDPVGPERQPALDEHPDDPPDEGQEGAGPVDLLDAVLERWVHVGLLLLSPIPNGPW
jgi:hypothetical protein